MITSFEQCKTGDVLNRHVPFIWYKPNRYISAFIRLFTKSWCSHTAIFIETWGEMMVLENDNSPTRLISFKNWAGDSEITIGRDSTLTDLQKKQISTIAISEIGKTGYDYKSIPSHVIYSISNTWIGRTGKNSSSKKVCSELVAYLFNGAKGYYPEWWLTVPRDIYEDKRFEIVYKGKAKDLISY